MLKGKVYLIGAGPGNAELITLKGYRLIKKADVILYDHLIDAELLKVARADVELIPVGKFAGLHTLPQDKINELLIKKAKEGKIVVRLKGGDPYLFGRGGEEAEACADAGIDFEVVPGVTSAIAGPCYAGIPVTHRDYTSNVAFVTGHRKEKENLEIPKAGTIVFLMGVSNVEKIVRALLENGWDKNTKIAAIENATCYTQRVITSTLSNFVKKIKKAKLEPPAVFVAGRVVDLGKKLNWFSRKTNVLVLGNHPEKYNYLGNIVHRRIIDCVPLNNYSRVDKILKKELETFDWLVFTSDNGVKFFFQRLSACGKDARRLSKAKIACIGKTTADCLRELAISADLVPELESSAGLLREFKKINMKGKRVLLPQSEIASAEMPNGLLKMGAAVEKMPVYKTIEIHPGEVNFDFIDRILFTSGSTVRAFVKRFGKVPKQIRVYCLGLPTQRQAKKYGIRAAVLSGKLKGKGANEAE